MRAKQNIVLMDLVIDIPKAPRGRKLQTSLWIGHLKDWPVKHDIWSTDNAQELSFSRHGMKNILDSGIVHLSH
ncbi:MAG TPA: hypothetical protein V6C69_17245 [Trichormus sp.]